MTWTKFTFLLLSSYGLYYGFNILLDYLRRQKSSENPGPASLRLVDEVKPVVVEEADFAPPEGDTAYPKASREIDAKTETKPNADTASTGADNSPPSQQVESGGVSISEMLRLYRQKAILQSSRYDFSNS